MSSDTPSPLPRRSPGRPREFDVDAAIDATIPLFRERGYNAASVSELGLAMKLTAGSIYKAFGDKRTVFLHAFERYSSERHRQLQLRIDAETTGFEKIKAVLLFYAASSCGDEGRRGCLVAASAVELATFDAEMAGIVHAALQRVESMLCKLIDLGRRDGSIPLEVDARATACAVLSVLQGFRVIGKVGRSSAEMHQAVEQTMRILR